MTKTTLAAGEFSTWLEDINSPHFQEKGSDVPCGECTACCHSSFFIHIKPEEKDTLAHIPKELLFYAPMMEKGNVLMGYDEHGNCPMLKDNKCSIYQHRPQTCRNYDCRIFTATGFSAGEEDQSDIIEQTKRWAFDMLDNASAAAYAAVQAAAKFIMENQTQFPEGIVPKNATDQALFSLKIYSLFLDQEKQDTKIDEIVAFIKQNKQAKAKE